MKMAQKPPIYTTNSPMQQCALRATDAIPHIRKTYFRSHFAWMQRGVTTDLKIDWIWHLLINVLRVLSRKLANLHGKQHKLSVPLYYILVNKSHDKSHFWRLYSICTYFKGLKGIKTRKM